MLPAKIPTVDLYAGDTAEFPVLAFREGDVPMDLTGWAFEAHWRVTPDAAEYLPIVVEVPEPVTGRVLLSISAESMADMTGVGVWDLEGHKDGKVKTFARGKTQLTKDVTHG